MISRSNVLETMESDSLLFIDENTKLKEPWWVCWETLVTMAMVCRCSKKEIMKEIRLPFVDQLKSVSQRSNLTMQGVPMKIMEMTIMTTVSGEAGLAQILLDDGRIQLSHYGHLVAYGLNKVGDHCHNHRLSLCGSMQWWFCQEKTNWVTYNLAGLYWRMKGDAFESIECLRYFDTIYPPIIIDYHQFQIPRA